MTILKKAVFLLFLLMVGCKDLHSLSNIDWNNATVYMYRDGCVFSTLKVSGLPPSVVCKMRDIVTSFLDEYSVDIVTYVPEIMVYTNNTTINFLDDGVVVNTDGYQYSRSYRPSELKYYSEIKMCITTNSVLIVR